MAAVLQVAALLASIALAEILAELTRAHAWRLLSFQANLEQISSWLFARRLPHDFSPMLSIVALAALSIGAAFVLRRRVRPVDIVGGS